MRTIRTPLRLDRGRRFAGGERSPIPSQAVNRRTSYAAVALIVVTLGIWMSRIGLAWGDDSLTVPGKLLATVPVAVFVGLALVAGLMLARATGSSQRAHQARVAVQAPATWTIGYWALRLPWLLARSHPGAFKVVHTMLALISVAIAGLVLVGFKRPEKVSPASRRVRA